MKTALEKGMKYLESFRFPNGIHAEESIKIALQDFADKVEKQGLKHNDKKSKHLVIWNFEWKQLKKKEGLS